MRKIALLVVFAFWATGSAIANAITVDGQLDDWIGTTNWANIGTAYNHAAGFWAPMPSLTSVSSWDEDWTVGGNGFVGPGYGGQNFDVEAAYLKWGADGTLYGAFSTGFDRGGQKGWGGSGSYTTGDLFFNLEGNGQQWDLAIALSTHPGFTEGDVYVIGSPDSSYYTPPSDYPSSAPARLKGSLSGVPLGQNYVYKEGDAAEKNYASGNPTDYSNLDHNIVEFALGPQFFPVGTSIVAMHYTQSCGNDFFDLESATRPQTLVPEPGTAILALGAALAAAYARRRRRKGGPCPTDVA